MTRLEDITVGAAIEGVLPDGLVTVVAVQWIGTVAINLTYRDAAGQLGSELLYREREPTLEVATAGSPWSFDGDGGLFRLVSEAHRIRLAWLFDPLLAVHTSLVEPLPHQITAVYGEMLPRQPLRFLLADDPGAGKTIMTGLFIKELLVRGDLARCLIVCPGNLAEQWQDELDRRFHLPFEIMTNDALEAARTGNWFLENPLAICRLDKLSRNQDVQDKLKQGDWDLVVCDEAHKLSATYFGSEVKYTKRYRLAQLLSTLTRHFLLLTATPHNGKEADFQLFMALLDGDRFEGKFRDGVHTADTSDLMRRLVKEQLLKFDGRPLFPERVAYTVGYQLSDAEAELYRQVTDYVREEFNRAEALEGGGQRGTVGFALTILQRRLASSPEAIHQSLRRRRERLQKRLREEQLMRRGGAGLRVVEAADLAALAAERRESAAIDLVAGLPAYTEDDLDDLEDAPEGEVEEAEERVVDQASAARTIAELQTEIGMLERLERSALRVRQSGTDKKWDELSRLLQNNSEMFDAHGHRRKLVIFSEHRDTLSYLADQIRALIGKPEAVVTIHGGMGREERKKAQEGFTHDKEVEILVATDAAGEGINLQRAHLMVNYDLPWNPNRLEQRFGRIHRIGQTEVCHLWNLVAHETREGEVYQRLLEKLAEERQALGGQVFDVLGRLTFEDRSLRELLLEAVRYGDQPEVRARLYQVVDRAMDHEHLRSLVEDRALTHDAMDVTRVRQIREDMERAEARRLQPHFIASFFIEAFRLLGGTIHEREAKRYEIKHVPAAIRGRDRQIGRGEPVMPRYERVTFEKSLISVPGKPLAAFVCPGHPLLDATIDLVVERYRDLLKQGAVLVDEADLGQEPRALVYLEHSIQDARLERGGVRRIVSKRLQFVEVDAGGGTRSGGPAPYLDYRPLSDEERTALAAVATPEWLRADLESKVLEHAAVHLVPEHLEEFRRRKQELVDKTAAAVKERLTAEVNYWDHRAEQLKEQELAGKVNAKVNSGLARQRADELALRLKKRLVELEQERKLSPLPPVVLGGAMVVPLGLLRRLLKRPAPPTFAADTERSERLAMAAVMAAERRLGFIPRDVSAEKLGYDIESSIPSTGRLRFIEVKGRVAGAETVTVTRREIMTGLNEPESFVLAIAVVDGAGTDLRYVRQPFQNEPDFTVTSVNFHLEKLLSRSEAPA
ncbi:MAG: helicase-related protein [Pirellulales bacterium]